MSMRFVAFDVETTGFSPQQDRIVEFCFAELTSLSTVERVWADRVNPGCMIPRDAAAVHGITEEDVVGKPRFERYAPGVQEFVSDAVLIAYNASFDVPFLHAALQRSGQPGLAEPDVIDPCAVFETCFDTSYRLEEAYQHVTGENHAAAHSADGDVQAMLSVLQHQVDVLDVEVTELITAYTGL